MTMTPKMPKVVIESCKGMDNEPSPNVKGFP